ncbi:MAG: hypothetical protein JWP97_6421 [Labilithrix sp.]|nr:hypothetical protein [Labilithrix sp.]
METKLLFLLVPLLPALAGCSAIDTTGSRTGELGNGGFYLSCDDAVACAPLSDDARQFPDAVAVGSTFTVRFEPPATLLQGTNLVLTTAPDRGIVIETVGERAGGAPFLTRGPKGLSGQKLGFGTIVARDAAGHVIDFTNLEVAKPDSLVVYRTDEDGHGLGTGLAVSDVTGIEIQRGARQTYRALAQRSRQTLAGSLATQWTSSDESVLVVDQASDGTVTVQGVAAGQASLVVTAATFEQRLTVQVQR